MELYHDLYHSHGRTCDFNLKGNIEGDFNNKFNSLKSIECLRSLVTWIENISNSRKFTLLLKVVLLAEAYLEEHNKIAFSTSCSFWLSTMC